MEVDMPIMFFEIKNIGSILIVNVGVVVYTV